MMTSTRTIPPDKVACIAMPRDETTPKMANPRLLLPDDMTAAQLIHSIRKRLSMKPEQAIFVFCDNRIVSGSVTVKELLYKQNDGDLILKVVYSLENAFG